MHSGHQHTKNQYVENIREYKMASHEVWNVKASERTAYLKLDWNEATIQPSPKVIEKIEKLVKDGNFYNLYPVTYNKTLIKAITEYVGLTEDYVQYFASSDSLQEYICRAYLNSHRRVLILSPSYDNFRLTAESSGAEIIFSDMRTDFSFDRSLFEEDIRNYRPSMVYICNPNNPTGIQHSREYIEYLVKSYPFAMFLIDEAYWEFSGITVKDLVKKYSNLLICRTFSKAFGLANFRIGYLISDSYNIKLINKIRNPKNITTFAQEAVIAALSDTDYMWEYVQEVKKAREYTYKELSKLGMLGVPFQSSGNFIMFKCNNSEYKSKLLKTLRHANIFIRDITQRPSVLNCVRISIGNMNQMKSVIHEFKTFSKGCEVFQSKVKEAEDA